MNADGSSGWDRASLRIVIIMCVLKALVNIVLVQKYGYHGDELYFIECGRHLALGYVDHPPLIPWIARIADAVGGGLITLRLPAIVAGVGTLAFTALLVREWRGGVRAQLIALLSLLVAPAHLRLGGMLNIPVFEIFLCTVIAYLVVRALARGERWTWPLAGAVLGLAILAKHSSILWGAALAVGIISTPDRKVFATRWPWLGVAVAVLFFIPNLAWQVQHDFATFEFMRSLRREILEQQGRGLYIAGQFLYFHPLVVPIGTAGLVFGFSKAGRETRPFAVLFLVMFVFLFVAGGKPYYLGCAYPAVLAAGGVALEKWLAKRAKTRRVLVASLAVSGVAMGLVTLPALPLPTLDSAIESVLGWAVPPMALTHDLHGMYGWHDHAATIDGVVRGLPANERSQATVLVGSYSQASALNLLRTDPTPRAVSGNMNHYFWGPDGDRGKVLVFYGLPRDLVARYYETCTETTRIHARLARPWDSNLPVFVCRGPLGVMTDWWPAVRRFGHMM
jgi:Dolichyl-phosphate-mannose-protein mannosyltransferase